MAGLRYNLCRSFLAWFYLCRINLFLQKIYLTLISCILIRFWTYFLNYRATLRLFSRSLHRCLADHERSSISRSFLCNRERLLVFERRVSRCVKIICFWLQYEISSATVQSQHFLLTQKLYIKFPSTVCKMSSCFVICKLNTWHDYSLNVILCWWFPASTTTNRKTLFWSCAPLSSGSVLTSELRELRMFIHNVITEESLPHFCHVKCV